MTPIWGRTWTTSPPIGATIERWGRPVAIAITIGILVGIVLSTVRLLPVIQAEWGEDYRFFMRATGSFLDGTGFYLPHQFAPYAADSGIDVLYPPLALLLFVPFAYLPVFLWWAIPIGIVAGSVLSWRPAWWTWPILALLLWLPRDQSIIIWGNTTMWTVALVALGLRLGWPALLILIKPTFVPFALIGIRRRSWWIALGVLVLVSLPMLPLWLEFITITRNNTGPWPGLFYSLPDYPFMLLPVVAWVGRQPTFQTVTHDRWSAAPLIVRVPPESWKTASSR